MKSKQEKQRQALTRLLTQLEAERQSRQSLQCQSYNLIVPSDTESRLSQEIYNLRVSLGEIRHFETIF